MFHSPAGTDGIERVTVLNWFHARPLPSGRIGFDALILESVFADIRTAARNRLEKKFGETGRLLEPLLTLQIRIWLGISRDSIRPIDWAKSDWSPTLVLTGTHDKRARPAESEGIFKNIPTPNKRIAYFEGAGHEDLFAFDSVANTVRVNGFLDSGLTVFSPGPGGRDPAGRRPAGRPQALSSAGAASGR